MDKITLIRNFSKFAQLYDKYADVQKLSARELLKQIPENNFSQILELGCGTGNYTFILKNKFKKAKIKAIDIASKMLEIAQSKLKDKRLDFILADAEEADFGETFDLITSNACFQWFQDLENTLLKYKNLLKNNGLIAFSTFGPLTFKELNKALNYLLKHTSIEATKFISKERLKEILGKNFKKAGIEEIKYQESFLSLKDLLEKIKYTGIRGNGVPHKIYFSCQFLKRLEDVYLDKFNQIKATYQVFFCKAWT